MRLACNANANALCMDKERDTQSTPVYHPAILPHSHWSFPPSLAHLPRTCSTFPPYYSPIPSLLYFIINYVQAKWIRIPFKYMEEQNPPTLKIKKVQTLGSTFDMNQIELKFGVETFRRFDSVFIRRFGSILSDFIRWFF